MSMILGFKTEKSKTLCSNVSISFEIPDNAKRFQDYFDNMFSDNCMKFPNWYTKVLLSVDGSIYTHDLGKVTQINGNVEVLQAYYYLVFKELFLQHFEKDRKITDPRALNLIGSKAPLTKVAAIGKLQTFAKGAIKGIGDQKSLNNAQSEEIRCVVAGKEATQFRIEKQEAAKLLREQKKEQKKLEAGK
jgi:hypothetical protein